MKTFINTQLILLFMLFPVFVLGQKKVSLTGYVKDMHILYQLENPIQLPDNQFESTNYNLVHNRLNFKFYATNNLTFALEIRNRLFSGKMISDFGSIYSESINKDDGWVDLSWNIIKRDRFFFNTTIDRFYADYYMNNLQIRIGRQRINWGINMVWNPNDIFNSFSFFDFDYEERPGSDAVLITWYPNMLSSFELAYRAANTTNNMTLAAKYRFNLKTYDIQAIGGWSGLDYVIGGGWSGNLYELGFRGEASWFIPRNNTNDSKESVSATVSIDYTFTNSLSLTGSFLYNSLGNNNDSYSLIDPNINLSAKRLAMGKYEIFAQIGYPFNPLINASLSGMYNPTDQSMYIGPTFSISVHNNLELMLTSQLMIGEEGTEYGFMGNTFAYFGRIRWSF